MPGMGFAAPVGGMGRRMKRGRLTGNPIPSGTKEKFSKSGQIILTETRRGRGLSGRDLKGFRRTIRLIRSVGMAPKGLGRRTSFGRKKR